MEFSESLINSREMKLKDAIIALISDSMDGQSTIVEQVDELWFEGSELHDVVITEDDCISEMHDESFTSSKVLSSETEVNFEYKKSMVQFWKSRKNKNLSLLSVKHKYRKVTSMTQLYR